MLARRALPLVWLLGATACTGGTNLAIDAAPGSDSANVFDAGVDAPDAPLDAPDPATRVEITVLGQDGSGEPATGAIAVFRDPSDQVVHHGPVDANGMAFAYLPNGGSVTVMNAFNQPDDLSQRSHQITTVRGVKPGDRLRAGSPRVPSYQFGAQTVMTGTFTSIPSMSQPFMQSSCATGYRSNNTTAALMFLASCVKPTFDLLSLYIGNDLVWRYVWQPALVYAAGGTFTIPNTWQPVPRNTTTILNVPPNLARVFSTLYMVLDGKPIELERGIVETPAAGTTTIPLMYIPGAGDSTVITAGVHNGLGIPHTHVEVTKGSPATVMFDLSSQPLPSLGLSSATQTSVSWAQTGAGSADARLVGWVARWVDANAVQNYANWQIIEPADGTTSSTLQSFPAAYSSDDPTIQSGLTMIGGIVQYVEYDNLDGYDAARPYGYPLFYVEGQFLDVEHRAHISRSHQ